MNEMKIVLEEDEEFEFSLIFHGRDLIIPEKVELKTIEFEMRRLNPYCYPELRWQRKLTKRQSVITLDK